MDEAQAAVVEPCGITGGRLKYNCVIVQKDKLLSRANSCLVLSNFTQYTGIPPNSPSSRKESLANTNLTIATRTKTEQEIDSFHLRVRAQYSILRMNKRSLT